MYINFAWEVLGQYNKVLAVKEKLDVIGQDENNSGITNRPEPVFVLCVRVTTKIDKNHTTNI